MTLIFIFGILFIILFLGFTMLIGSAVMNFVGDEVLPELTDLGMIGDVNMTQAVSVSATPVNNIIQSFTWLTGVLYLLMLIVLLGVVYTSRNDTSRWLIGFFLGLMLILILGSMFISNMYEEFYNGTDEFALILKEHVLLSWLILYSPMVTTVFSFIAGILMFSGIRQEEYV